MMPDRNLKLSQNFYLYELIEGKAINKKHYAQIWQSVTPQIITNLKHLAETALQPAREHFGVEIYVNTGYRPLWYEKLKNRSGQSTHTCYAKLIAAADITSPRIKTMDLYNFFVSRWPGGLGFYPVEDFMHVDTYITNPPRRW